MANKHQPTLEPPAAEATQEVDHAPLRPRNTATDSFEQNPLSQIPERLSMRAAEGLDDAGRVREALRIVISEGVSIAEAARRCHIAPSFLAAWREKYLTFLKDEPSIADQPLMHHGMVNRDADLVSIPQVAREQFAENWERLVEITRATPSTFRQHPIQLFLENSWLTSWLYHEGRLDRGVFAGVAVGITVLMLTVSFLMAGHFQPTAPKQVKVANVDNDIRRAAEVALNFFRAGTAAEKMKFVRRGEQARTLMEEYFREHPATSIPDAVLSKAMPGKDLYALEFDIPSLHRRHLCVVVDSGGEMLVDWETSSLFQEVHLEEIRKQKPTQPVRVAARVIADTYYNYGFNADAFTCYRLAYPGLELDLFAYAAKDSLEDQTLKALLKPVTASVPEKEKEKDKEAFSTVLADPTLLNERQITAVLEVKYPQGDKVPSNQVQIVRILNEEWVAR